MWYYRRYGKFYDSLDVNNPRHREIRRVPLCCRKMPTMAAMCCYSGQSLLVLPAQRISPPVTSEYDSSRRAEP